jgi:hypothetical protein
MKLFRIVVPIAMLLVSALASSAAHALDVDVFVVDTTTNIATRVDGPIPTLSGGAAVNLDADSPVGSPKAYAVNGVPVFNIARCQGCSGRARVFVSEGSIDKLVLTDAQITNVSSNTAQLRLAVSSGPLTVSGPGGSYPYAVELNGLFVAPLGAGSATDPANRIQVKATTSGSCDGPCMIDNPQLDPGEAFPSQYSVVAPPFLAAGLSQFSSKEQDNLLCSNVFDPITLTSLCQPALQMSIDVSLKSRHAARLPGSIGAFHVTVRCEPNDPTLQRGCEIMADFFASLGPKGFKVYDVRMEPSPGTTRDVDFRTPPVRNSPDAWLTKRGAEDDDDAEGNISNTRVRLESNGAGEVKARGLCPAGGCPASNDLPVRVYCGTAVAYETILHLNQKGDGKAQVIFSLPCPDPAVLVMDPAGQHWVAAPAIF